MKMDMPAQGADQAENALEQGGFAGAVFTHDGQIVPLPHRKLQMGQNAPALVAQRKVAALDQR